ncbi:MAG TPA: hypothetical protein VLG48_08745 [Candidatus Methylomirabilis sp.]|nr:hypothetical protein [Candidatus Methylomirabilis sp.]
MTGPARIPLRVECYSGYAADERPVAIQLGERRIPVAEVEDRWQGEDHAYFKLIGKDGMRYLIRQDRTSDTWELVLFEGPVPVKDPGR